MDRRAFLATAAGVASLAAVATWPRPGGQVATSGAVATWPDTGPARSAWSALPGPCVVCGQVIEYMATVAGGGYACAAGGPGQCVARVATPARPRGWPVNIPPDWPVWRMPDGHRCRHCGRARVAAIEWPAAGWWMCAPGGVACVCPDVGCCGPDEQVGDQLQGLRGVELVTLGRIERIEGPLGERRYLVTRPAGGRRWYAEDQLVV